MNQVSKIEAPPDGLQLLRADFPDNQISKLPKETRAQIDARKSDKSVMVWKCEVCGGAHHKNAVHLDYVGHAALTDRLLDADPCWSWEPVALDEHGLPAFDRNGGLWIKLTVLGVTRLGYGDAEGKTGGNAVKEAIGDALRNAAMRFGAALDLWHKGDLHADDGEAPAADLKGKLEQSIKQEDAKPYNFPDGPATGISQLKNMTRELWREVAACGDEGQLIGLLEMPEHKATIAQLERLENPQHREIWDGNGKDNPGLGGFIQKRRAEFMAEYARA